MTDKVNFFSSGFSFYLFDEGINLVGGLIDVGSSVILWFYQGIEIVIMASVNTENAISSVVQHLSNVNLAQLP